MAAEQHKRLETIDEELEDVKRHLSRIWRFIGETDNVGMADAGNHIRELRDRQELLEEEASAARAILTQRRSVLDDVDTIETYARETHSGLHPCSWPPFPVATRRIRSPLAPGLSPQ